MTTRTIFTPLAAILFTGLLLPAPATAQVIRGEIIDSERKPVPNARIELLDEERRLAGLAESGPAGTFQVEASGAGEYSMRVTRFGYRTITGGPYDLSRGEALEVYAVVHPDPAAIEGVGVEVEAMVPRLAAVGYYERMAAGFGHFIDREMIRDRGGNSVTDILRDVPRLRVRQPTPRIGGRAEFDPGIMMSGGFGGGCAPTLYIDGILMEHGGTEAPPLRPDRYVTPDAVEAIEVYSGPATTPPQYSSMAPCGVILLWTRHTNRRDLGEPAGIHRNDGGH